VPLVDARLLNQLVSACRDCLELHFAYRNHAGEQSERTVQPLRLANYGRRWYLIAWDQTRGDWRSFRADRIQNGVQIGTAFLPRPPPPDVAAGIERGIAYTPFHCRVTLRLRGTLEDLVATIPLWCGVLEAESATTCLLRVGADSPESLLAQLLMIGQPAELVEGHALRPALQDALARMQTLLQLPTTDSAFSPSDNI